MKKSSIKEQEKRLIDVFSRFSDTYNELIYITSSSIADGIKCEIDRNSAYLNDDEKTNILARGSSQLKIQYLKSAIKIIEDAIDNGRLEHCRFVDIIISNINKNIDALRDICVDAGGFGDEEHADEYIDEMFSLYDEEDEENESQEQAEDETVSKAGMCTVQEHSIANECPEFMKQADCVISSPPCNLTTLRRQYNEAGAKFPWNTYEPFIEHFFKHIDAINPELLYIQAYPSNKNALIHECEKRFKHVNIDDSYYHRHKKNQCWMIRCGNEYEAPGPEKKIDASAYIRWICKNIECRCIADPCTGTGIVGINAHRYEKKFVGTELNKNKIAVLLSRIDDYDRKVDEKRRKKKNSIIRR